MRIRENLGNTLIRKFVKVMKGYQAIQTKYKTDIKKKVKRRLTILKPDITKDEIDSVMNSGSNTNELLRSVILKVCLIELLVIFKLTMENLQGEVNEEIRTAISQINDKYQDILRIESSIIELQQLFVDFALLVDQQGDLLDVIEHNVKNAESDIERANIHLTNATELLKSVRYKQFCCAAVIFVIIAIIIGVALTVAGVQGKL